MSTHNIGFYEDLTKIIFEVSSNIIESSNTHLISSASTQMRTANDHHFMPPQDYIASLS